MKVNPYCIEGPWKGGLAILSRPRGGDWLDDDVVAWKKAGIDVAVSLLTADEITSLSLEREPQLARHKGSRFRGSDRFLTTAFQNRQSRWLCPKRLNNSSD